MTMSDVWRYCVHSREIWPTEHLLHNLDLVLYAILAAIVGLAYIGCYYHDRQFCRWSDSLASDPNPDYWVPVEDIPKGGEDV